MKNVWSQPVTRRSILAGVSVAAVPLMLGTADPQTAHADILLPGAPETPAINAIAVADIPAMQAALSAATGILWTPILQVDVTMIQADGSEIDVQINSSLSLTGEPLYALENTVPPIGPYDPTPTSSPVHFAYVVADATIASAELVAAGWPRILTLKDPTQEKQTDAYEYAVHEYSNGVFLEVFDAGGLATLGLSAVPH